MFPFRGCVYYFTPSLPLLHHHCKHIIFDDTEDKKKKEYRRAIF